jgi:catechol 2,3-dioxygenase-like lactoylglutathione lyase family enzyme
MIDHIILEVSDFTASKKFYEEALSPLGYKTAVELESMASYGVQGMPDLWIRHGRPGGPVHLAFSGADRQAVEDFHTAAVRAGGRCKGTPGRRTEYFQTFFSACVLDPDGNKIEAICHDAAHTVPAPAEGEATHASRSA